MSQTSKYGSKNPVKRFLIGRFQGRMNDAVRDAAPRSVLSLGCSDAHDLAFLAERQPGIAYSGIDIDAAAIDLARMRLPQAALSVGDVYAYVPPQPVGLVALLEVLEHLEHPGKALAHVATLPADRFLISVPQEPYFRGLNLLAGNHVKRLGNHPEHVNLWSAGRFRTLVGEHLDIVADYSSFPWTMFLARKKASAP